jgi:hypothetical protein
MNRFKSGNYESIVSGIKVIFKDGEVFIMLSIRTPSIF